MTIVKKFKHHTAKMNLIRLTIIQNTFYLSKIKTRQHKTLQVIVRKGLGYNQELPVTQVNIRFH
jgi:hypothetical protein